MVRFRSFAGLATCGLLALAACGPAFQAPEVDLASVRLGGLGVQGGTLLVDVRVVNPNRFSLTAERVEYRIALRPAGSGPDEDWTELGAGTFEEPVTVAARDTVQVRIPVEFRYAAVGRLAGGLLRNGTFAYRAEGSLRVRTPVGRRQVPFRRHGTLTLGDTAW